MFDWLRPIDHFASRTPADMLMHVILMHVMLTAGMPPYKLSKDVVTESMIARVEGFANCTF